MNVCIMIYTYTATVETNSSKLLLMKYDVTTMIERESRIFTFASTSCPSYFEYAKG